MLLLTGLLGIAVLGAEGADAPGEARSSTSFSISRDRMTVAVEASAPLDSGIATAEHRWSWGDGTSQYAGASPTAAHVYSRPGKYTVTLDAVDEQGAVSTATQTVSVATGTLDWNFYDFFNVPPGEYWDARAATYGETPIGAECFTASAISNGLCFPSDPNVPDVASYPYTIWTYTGETVSRRAISAPYRLRATGVDISGYDLTAPVFLPVLNSGEPAGAFLDFSWSSQFVDTAAEQALDAMGCANPGPGDGYYSWSQVTLTMDLQQSRRVFGVNAVDAATAQQWWDANTNSRCAGGPASRGAVEQALWNWFLEMGGGQSSSAIGKYDIMNAYAWFLDQVFLDMSATVDPDGTTHVTINHLAWGTTNLLNRMFYWGSASYADNHLDSTQAAGWYGMEPFGWFEDMSWSGSLNASSIDFQLTAVLSYGFEQFALPGPDGNLDQVDDFSVWAWRPHLHDSLNDLYGHPFSELDRYPGVTDVESAPGSPTYNTSHPRAFIPTSWDLFTGETWTFQFPTGNVVFYDPNLTPIGATGTSNDHVEVSAPLSLYRTQPASYGTWNAVAKTWTVIGPSVTGGSVGSPGDYPDEAWGAIFFVPEPGFIPGFAAGSALLALLHRRRRRR
jgi:hypothetical protein